MIGSAAIAKTLGGLSVARVEAAGQCSAAGSSASPWGPIAPKLDPETGLRLIQLPAPFRYRSYGWTGDPMDDAQGTPTPELHDGMAVIQELGRNHLILVRDHEVDYPWSAGLRQCFVVVRPGGRRGHIQPHLRSRVRAIHLVGPKHQRQHWKLFRWRNAVGYLVYLRRSGYRDHDRLVEPAWLRLRGRCLGFPPRRRCDAISREGNFSHEAMATDPATGITYLTEDGPSAPDDIGSGFYRFLYKVPGKAQHGGTLQMLAVSGRPQLDFQEMGCESRAFPVRWVTIEDPDPDVSIGALSTFQQGLAGGGANFRRLEGCWYGASKIYFVSTTGGPDIARAKRNWYQQKVRCSNVPEVREPENHLCISRAVCA